jgi:hypothetical protein
MPSDMVLQARIEELEEELEAERAARAKVSIVVILILIFNIFLPKYDQIHHNFILVRYISPILANYAIKY